MLSQYLASLRNQFSFSTVVRPNTSKIIFAAASPAKVVQPPVFAPAIKTPALKSSDFVKDRFNYRFGLQRPFAMPTEVMKFFGFDPKTNTDECPILTAPEITAFGLLSGLSAANKGEIYTGMVDLSSYGSGHSHFYLVAANCGNTAKIASACKLPESSVRARLGSPLGMIATWSGCMMAGGASIHTTPAMIQTLSELGSENRTLNQAFGRGDLTDGNDMVELSNAERATSDGAVLNAFLARTMYFHSLSGSVLHLQYVDKGGEIYWFWVGAGGKGFNSKWVNNFVAMDLDLGMWPDMARSIQRFYEDSDTVKQFVAADPKALSAAIAQLISSTKAKTGFFRELLQTVMVMGGYPARLTGTGVSDFRPYSVKGK